MNRAFLFGLAIFLILVALPGVSASSAVAVPAIEGLRGIPPMMYENGVPTPTLPMLDVILYHFEFTLL